MQPELIFLGFLLGALGSGLCFLLHDPNDVTANIIGGCLGGLFAAVSIGHVAIYTRSTIALLILSGYVGGSVLHAILYNTPARPRGDGDQNG